MKIVQSLAVLFDLDGVLVPTVRLHKAAWKELFDQVLPEDVSPYGDQDYFNYVDGKPRYDGVSAVLASRGVDLPQGNPADGPTVRSICGLGNRKNAIFERLLNEEGIEPYPDTVDVLRHLMGTGKRLAVVSSSRNANTVLSAAGIRNFFDVIVDGNVRAREGLKGKPAPDTYAFAAHLLGVRPEEAVVVEDALSGVAAGRAGGFGIVVGVDRGAGRQALLDSGADHVVDQLIEMIQDGSARADLARPADLDPTTYPVDPWALIENKEGDSNSATLFSVSNGNIGVRGAGDPSRDLGSGTFMSGFHDTFTIKHPETAYGFARVGQVIQGVPDASDFSLSLEGYPLGSPVSASQKVDFRRGISSYVRRYRTDDGADLFVTVERMVCLFDPHLALYTLIIESPDRTMTVDVDARINGNAPRRQVSNDPRKSNLVDGCGIHEVLEDADGDQEGPVCHVYRCNNSQMTAVLAVRQYAESTDGDPGARSMVTSALPEDVWHLRVPAGGRISVRRYAAYRSPSILPVGVDCGLVVRTREGSDARSMVLACLEDLDSACHRGAGGLEGAQRSWLEDFWRRGDVQVAAGDGGRIQQVSRWEIFQLAQATAQVRNGVGAKGLSGSGYDGHYFWDTEIYILPFLTYTDPARARAILHYRHEMLPAARRRAAIMNLDGALFPWRTINGEEGSAYFPTGTAQYHIDADIAYALMQYVLVSGDDDYLGREGIDILVETARMWASLGSYQSDGRFHIHSVTGPDEYTALVDDNLYTNQMARFNLMAVIQAVHRLDEADETGEILAQARQRLGFGDEDLKIWKGMAEAMFMPYANQEGVHAQDAQFMNRPKWDFEHCPARPLLLYYHPLAIYGHKVLKQTDVVLALFLLSSWFTPEQKLADFDYYDPLTTGDSTLSAASQSILAAEVGRKELAMDYFRRSLFADVFNLHDNTEDGIHLAAAGGVWSTLVCGFGGMRDTGGTAIGIDPRLPDGWTSLEYTLLIRGTSIRVTVTPEGVGLQRMSGPSMVLNVNGHPRQV